MTFNFMAAATIRRAFLVAQTVKSLPASAGGGSVIPGSGHGSPLQYSCLGNPTDRGAWQGCSSWGHKESDRTEQLTLTFQSLSAVILGTKKVKSVAVSTFPPYLP